ncbi:hypothetical protein [Methanobrevibacter arboriphilus]|uniref:hypothetical protein n=1 Tax=Methanobrevibacter arboriphilus TaxID=39441 RepID=UPI0005B2D83A|nr:hypothetical protein [Methanobrevibacter arboriphilus]
MRFKIGFLYGFLVWLIPFVISFLIYPLKIQNNPLFETIMSIVLVITGSIFLLLYIKDNLDIKKLELFELGFLFFIISIILDSFLFLGGPMKMSFYNYMLDIGLTYLIYPILAIFYTNLIKIKNLSFKNE